jgi:flagellar assembly protein FliH
VDQVGREQRGATALLNDRAASSSTTDRPLDRSRRLLKPTRFDPPTLTPIASAHDIADQHADQLAAAMAVAREEGLRAARAEVAAAVGAHDAARRELEAAVVALQRAAALLLEHDTDSITGVQEQAVLFGVGLAEELLGRELESNDELVTAAVERAINLVPDRGDIVLRLNAADVAVVNAFTAGMPSIADRVVLVQDAAVERGGCVAVVGPLRIDTQLTPALERVRAALRS